MANKLETQTQTSDQSPDTRLLSTRPEADTSLNVHTPSQTSDSGIAKPLYTMPQTNTAEIALKFHIAHEQSSISHISKSSSSSENSPVAKINHPTSSQLKAVVTQFSKPSVVGRLITTSTPFQQSGPSTFHCLDRKSRRGGVHLSAMGGVMLGLLLCLAAVVEADDLQYTVHIAVLVPDDDIRPYTRKRMRPAIDLAVEKMTDPGGPLQEVDVQVHYADSKCDIAWGIKGAIELHFEDKADVFLGPVCDYTAAPVARQAAFWDTPVLTYAQAKDFRQEKALTKVTRVGNDCFQLSEMLNNFFGSHKWREFTILYNPSSWDQLGTFLAHITAESIHNSLAELTGYTSAYFKFNADTVDLAEMLQEQVGTKYGGKYCLLEEIR